MIASDTTELFSFTLPSKRRDNRIYRDYRDDFKFLYKNTRRRPGADLWEPSQPENGRSSGAKACRLGRELLDASGRQGSSMAL